MTTWRSTDLVPDAFGNLTFTFQFAKEMKFRDEACAPPTAAQVSATLASLALIALGTALGQPTLAWAAATLPRVRPPLVTSPPRASLEHPDRVAQGSRLVLELDVSTAGTV